jgi:hypothetical protein
MGKILVCWWKISWKFTSLSSNSLQVGFISIFVDFWPFGVISKISKVFQVFPSFQKFFQLLDQLFRRDIAAKIASNAFQRQFGLVDWKFHSILTKSIVRSPTGRSQKQPREMKILNGSENLFTANLREKLITFPSLQAKIPRPLLLCMKSFHTKIRIGKTHQHSPIELFSILNDLEWKQNSSPHTNASVEVKSWTRFTSKAVFPTQNSIWWREVSGNCHSEFTYTRILLHPHDALNKQQTNSCRTSQPEAIKVYEWRKVKLKWNLFREFFLCRTKKIK